MKGQWIGLYTGSVDGQIMVNIDETAECYLIDAYIMPDDIKLPVSVAYMSTKGKGSKQSLTAYINPVDPKTGYQGKWEKIKESYGNDIVHSDTSKVELNFEGNKLNISSFSDIGVELICTLEKSNDTNQSIIKGEKKSWIQFKELISGMESSKYLFRGQKEPWRLRTTFHRKRSF
jgi:hypothetical protein